MDGAAWCIRVSRPWVGSGDALTALAGTSAAFSLPSACPEVQFPAAPHRWMSEHSTSSTCSHGLGVTDSSHGKIQHKDTSNKYSISEVCKSCCNLFLRKPAV